MKNKLQPTRTSFSRNFQCKKAPRWLSKFFHFDNENRADQLKKPPCICLIGTFWLVLCGLLVCGMLLADALEMPTGRGDPDSCPAGLTTCHSQLCNVYNSWDSAQDTPQFVNILHLQLTFWPNPVKHTMAKISFTFALRIKLNLGGMNCSRGLEFQRGWVRDIYTNESAARQELNSSSDDESLQ